MNMEDITMAVKVVNPIDPLNNYLKLFDIIKLPKMKLINGDNFVVSNGILQCHNYFIPLDSISMVEMARIQFSLSFSIFIFIFGLILAKLDISFAIISVFGIVLAAIIIFLNTKLPYTMTIHLNNNIFCTYMNRNKEFIQDIMEKMQECINNRKGEYNFMLNKGKIEYNNDHSINIGGGVGGDVIAAGANKETYKKNTIYQQPKIEITAEDWMNLEKYFKMQQKEFPADGRNYKICGNLITYIKRKDASKIKGYLQAIGTETLRTIFAASTNVAAAEAVKPILHKILSLNG